MTARLKFSLSGHGYTDAFWYSIGKDMESNFIGWNGNHSSNASNVLEDNDENGMLNNAYDHGGIYI